MQQWKQSFGDAVSFMTSCLIPLLAGGRIDWDMLSEDDAMQSEQRMWEYMCCHCDAKLAMGVLTDDSNQCCMRFDSTRKVRWLRCVGYGEYNTARTIQKWWRELKLRQKIAT